VTLLFWQESNVRFWPFSAPGEFNLSGRLVPGAEVNLGIFNVSYRES
jgi:hypothetical protein